MMNLDYELLMPENMAQLPEATILTDTVAITDEPTKNEPTKPEEESAYMVQGFIVIGGIAAMHWLKNRPGKTKE
ncbi:hypothetical protein H0V99_01340 [Candidatus Saccharibacteria bacterium]|nr:hypothetical protein [Candidatus Saccharibacteria bacterium]